MSSRACIAAVLLLGCVSCDTRSSESVRAQRSVSHLCWVENRIRNAPNPEKATFLADFARSPCPAPDACLMRDRCVVAYTLHVEALQLTAAAKQLIADHRDAEAAALLGAAQTNLQDAGSKIQQCTSLAANLRHTYSID
ncbi:MAG: hypothetical protein EOO73_36505 [Myxococcales bacterium]|nr:MAG: hypothetical protein EOO73_36505 [Myxococcales bacterium]